MNEFMIDQWNSVVTKNDIVYHVGDFGFGDDSMLTVIYRRLNGREKHLIRGNHDRSRKGCVAQGWNSVQSQARYTTAQGYNVLLQHRPWQDDVPPPGVQLIVHGHIHNHAARRGHINLNVSVEAVNYVPVNLDEAVLRHMRAMGWAA